MPAPYGLRSVCIAVFCYQALDVVRVQNCVKLRAMNSREGTGSPPAVVQCLWNTSSSLQMFAVHSVAGNTRFTDTVRGLGGRRHHGQRQAAPFE